MTEEVKLKACPFTGEALVAGDDGAVCFIIDRCGQQAGVRIEIWAPTEEEAIALWNTRPAEQELLDALRDGLRVTEPFGPNSTRGGPEELDWRANAVALISKHGGGQ